MRRGITILLFILGLGFYSNAQSCTATISYTDSITSGGTDIFTFTAVGTFSATATFTWSFGDGSGGQGQVVNHSYLNGANSAYTIVLTVSDSAHSCSYTTIDSVYPRGYSSPCSAYFTSTNVDTLFTLSTINTGVPPFTYNWDLPNGTFSTLPDPTFTIGSTGTYSGFVVVTDSTGCIDTVNYVLSYANNAGNNVCQAYFYVLPDSTAGSYTAVDCSRGSGLSYLWAFGDGDTSTLQYPTHNYAVPGYYTICLTVYSANGCASSFCDSAFYANKTGGGPMSGINVTSKSAATGITNIPANKGISIYPNPASTSLALQVSSSDKIEKSTIYNTEGQKVAEFGSSALISIAPLNAGLYLIEVRTNNGSFRSTFMKN